MLSCHGQPWQNPKLWLEERCVSPKAEREKEDPGRVPEGPTVLKFGKYLECARSTGHKTSDSNVLWSARQDSS